MSELKKLFQVKRILAMALAVAMTITSLPATAHAAELGDIPAVTAADADDTSAESNSETETEGEETAQQPADTADDAQTETADDAADDAQAETADQPTAGDADVPQDAADPVQTQAEGDATEPGAKAAAAELGTSEFSFSFYWQEPVEYMYQLDDSSPVADGKKLSAAFLSNYYIAVNQGTSNEQRLCLDDSSDPIVATITYQWLADGSPLGDAKKLTEDGALPVDAGDYTLKLVLPAKENEYAGAEATFSYKITKPEVRVSIDDPATVPVGTKKSDVPLPMIYSVSADNGKTFTYVADDPETTANEEADNEVKFTPIIRDAATGVELAGDETLVKNGEYMLAVVPEFIGANKDKYEKNYTWVSLGEQKLTIGELKTTRLTLTPDAEYGAKAAAVANDENERTVQIIKGASAKDLQKLTYTAKLETEDGVDAQSQPKWKTIDGEMLGAWYTTASYSEPWKEGTKTYCNLTLGGKLDAAPATAGAYVYRVSYAGDEKEYAGCYADILVIVDVAEIIVRPTVPAQTVFYDGQSVRDVLSQITYVLPYADGREDKGQPALYPQTDNMWGTSYDASDETQPYKPDFELIEIVKDKAGKETGRNTYTSSSSAILTLGNEYIVRFTGKKNVYDAGGSVRSRKDINAAVDSMDPATCGFKVKTDADTLEAEANTCTITVVEKDKAIDVTEIENAATAKAQMTKETVGALADAYTKTYDGRNIFDYYADYKKAKLTKGTSDAVKDFRYEWQISNYSYDQLLATEKDESGKDVPSISKEELENSWNWSSYGGLSPINAGIYRLHITYSNSRVKGYAEPADVYFVIKKQEITLKFKESIKLVGNAGNSVDEFTTNHAEALNNGTTLEPSQDQPAKAEDWKNVGLPTASTNYAYRVTWGFYTKRTEIGDDGQEKEVIVDGKPVYDRAYTLQGESEDKYFLGVSGFQMGRYDGRLLTSTSLYAQNYTVNTDIYIPITVKPMGTDDIVFDGITTAGGKRIEKTKTYDGESIYDLIKDDLAKLNAQIIIKTDADSGVETKEKVTFNEGEYRLTYTVQYSGSDEVKTYGTLPTEKDEWAWAKNGGTYWISAEFGGNERYSPLYAELAVITVNPMEVVLTIPALTEEFEAGRPVSDVLNAAERAFNQQATVDVKPKKSGETILAADKEKYFTRVERDGMTGFLAWWYVDEDGYGGFSGPWMSVYDNSNDESYWWGSDAVLQGAGDKRYSLRCDVWYAEFRNDECIANYEIVDVEPAAGTPIKVARGASTVQMNEYEEYADHYPKIDITDHISVPETTVGSIVKEHTVTIQDGIAYGNGSPEGNIVRVTIQAPSEYASYENGYSGAYLDWNKVGYEQSIKNAAGSRLVGPIRLDGNTIKFAYNATAANEQDKKDLEFCIRWEEDYSEKFILKFSKAVLLGNLQDAVEPKSLAFNAAPKTMVVGQELALDVKIQKEQNADIICLGYEVSDGGQYMHIDEFGKVTALAEGKATVEVYPMHLVDGKKERIAGAKSAKTTITVKKVNAPKVTKVTAKDTSITVEYALPNRDDGYRREIYVVEGKNIKADAIERKITDEMKNEQWQGIFAAAPSFLSYDDEEGSYRIDDSKTVRYVIRNLDPQKDYTVYVRNVSAVRSLADGCQVSLSAAGTAKSCKTSLILMKDIAAVLENEEIKTIDYEAVKGIPTEDAIWYAWNADTIGYEVPLTKKDVQLSLEGLFTDAAGDSEHAPIPLAGQDLQALKNKYAVPKLAYYFYDHIYDGYDAFYGYKVIEDVGYTKTSSVAAINNKGKVTLKQPGSFTVCAVDTVSGAVSNKVNICVTAEADSITAKNTTMEVGQRIRLENLLVYKQGNTVLDQSWGHYATYDRIDVKAAQASLKSAGKESSFGISDGGYLTAYAKDSVNLTLQDTKLGRSVTVKVTAKDLSPVKNLKAVNVIDNRFDVQFEMNPYAEAYRIEITDAKKVIRSIYVENIPFSDAPGYDRWTHDSSYADDDWGTSGSWGTVGSNEHYDEHWFRTGNALCRADKTNGKWVLTYRIKKLTQASKYNISVTALYGEAVSKTVKKAAATTKLPAYDDALPGKIEAGRNYAVGMNITTVNDEDGYGCISSENFISGNTYSLQASGANQKARIAGTDTLTWTSSNKKVATVQATSGGYGATLKALKDGETVIEVKSKVLKAAVARYTIHVSTVGDAYKGRDYYGDNEDLRGDGSGKTDPVTELTVGVAEPVELSAGQSKKFKVTLTEEGQYTAYQVDTDGSKYSLAARTVYAYNDLPFTWTIPYAVDGPFTGSVIVEKTGSANASDPKNRTLIQPDETIPQTQSGAWYVFTAPKDGLYGVWSNGSVSQYVFTVYKQSAEQDEPNTIDAEAQKLFYELKQGELVYLKAYGSNSAVKVAEAKFETLTAGSSVTVNSGSEKWFVFEPEEEDQYDFTGLSNSGITVYDTAFGTLSYDNYNGSYDDNGNYRYTYTYTLGTKVYIRVKNNSYYNAINMSVKKKGSFQKFDADGTYTINREFTGYSDYLYIRYKVEEDGFYTFSSDAVDGASYYMGYGYLDIDSAQRASWNIGLNSGKTSEFYLTVGQSVRIRIRSDNYPETWNGVVIRAEKTGNAPAQITADSEPLSCTVPANGFVWYAFTAEENADYVATFLKSADSSGSLYAYWHEDVDNASNWNYLKSCSVGATSGAFMGEINIGAEETRYLRITNSNSTDTAFQVKIQKVPDETAVTADTPVELTLADNWVSFTADAEAYYTFSLDKDRGNTGSMYAYENKGDTTALAYSSSGTLSMLLSQNQKIWLKVLASTPGDVTKNADKLKVTKSASFSTVLGAVESKDIDVITSDGGSCAVVQFTADATDSYTFTFTGATAVQCYSDAYLQNLVAGITSSSTTENDKTVYTITSGSMQEDETYYIEITAQSADGVTMKVSKDSEASGGDEEGGEGGESGGSEGGDESTPDPETP